MDDTELARFLRLLFRSIQDRGIRIVPLSILLEFQMTLVAVSNCCGIWDTIERVDTFDTSISLLLDLFQVSVNEVFQADDSAEAEIPLAVFFSNHDLHLR